VVVVWEVGPRTRAAVLVWEVGGAVLGWKVIKVGGSVLV
jgi:hypothetical protein